MPGARPGERRGGRKKGVPNKANAATRARIQQEADPIGFLTGIMRGEPIKAAPIKDAPTASEVYPTVDQRVSAAKILADKMIPNAKSRPVRLDLPDLNKPEDLLSAVTAIVKAMAAGSVTPDEAAVIAGVLELKRRAVETVEIERRLAELERRQEQKP